MLRDEAGKETPCDECLPPLDKNNILPWRIFLKVQNQLIMGFNGPVSLNKLAIYAVMDRMGIPLGEQLDLEERVVNLYYSLRRELNPEAEAERMERLAKQKAKNKWI